MSDLVTETVALSSRVLGDAGHGDFIWGHSSARDPDGRGVWIKPSGYGLEEITPELVQLLDWNGEILHGTGQRHVEYPIHTEIMAARPDVGGVVHTHSPHAVALAAAGQELRPVSHAANYFVPPSVPRFTDTADLIVTAELGQSLTTVLADTQAVFLVNHGIVTVGPDLPTATIAALLLEEAAKQQLLTAGYGGFPSWSPREESLAKRERIYHPAALDQLWQYLVRRLDHGTPGTPSA
ncbi:class II aldolase/adducin family protein [Streptomyces radicis]|uniref:L-ribulose-5-phosphate 4-epimerase n=1 Tax=Streptomyces radicis TaxID=1750517 RepID=A0A3A9VQS1_9ACTN|nr:class II aldolase/adducin family protein [Streptomyces radicis]RKN03461.1 class II aldolase/adducin family protein [Streptomyces radicis]RKN13323.1 class II aldolase/adducin family protein [Streptomyces radicis]